MDVTALDLNLLAPLQALLELRHVTRAAERIHLSQSTMSATLARLRRHFDDELLVRVGTAYNLTPLGRRLLPLVEEAIRSAESAFGARDGFDVAVSDRRFVVTASNYAAGVVGPPLRALLAIRGPAVSVQFHSMPKHALAERDVLESDLMIGPRGYGLPGANSPLFTDDFVCLFSAGHPAAGEMVDVQVLSRYPHAAVSFAHTVPTAADELLDRLGVRRHVAVLADDWLSLPWQTRGTDLITVLPRRVARWAAHGGEFVIQELPGDDRAAFSEATYWHPSRASDPGLQWLRKALHEAVGSASDDLAE